MDGGHPAAMLAAEPKVSRAPGPSLAASTLAAMALVHPLAWLSARWHWRLDMLTHFREPAAAVSLLALAVALRRRRIGLASALLALGLVQLGALLVYDGPNPVPAAASGRRLKMVIANVLHTNTDYQALADLIRHERPDVVGLTEFSADWRDGLDQLGLRDEFPYRAEHPGEGRGIALWLRRPPLGRPTIEVVSAAENPAVRAVVDLGGSACELWLIHPPNPIDHRGRHLANTDLIALGERIGAGTGARLAVGDLNRTEGSPFFADFLRATGLRDSRLGFGRQPSWPAWSWYRIAIDHAFASPEVAIVDRRLGPYIRSDHLPLILEVAPAAREAKIEAYGESPSR